MERRPLEERGEALEACERLFAAATVRASSAKAGLARGAGIEVLRLGPAVEHDDSRLDPGRHALAGRHLTAPMIRAPRKQGLFILSLLFATAPFDAGLIRAFQTGSDFRLLWMAAASLVGGALGIVIGRTGGERTSLFSLGATSFVLAGASTVVAGYLLGARAGPGVAMIGVVFGLCWAVSSVLERRSRADMLD